MWGEVGNTNLNTNFHKFFMEGKVVYPEESYVLVGCAFAVYNAMGYGHHERNYQKGFALELQEKRLSFQKEVCVDVLYKGNPVGKYFLDFLVEDKIVIEYPHNPLTKSVVTIPSKMGLLA